MLGKNGPVIKSVESILRPDDSLWWKVEKICERGRLLAGNERDRDYRR